MLRVSICKDVYKLVWSLLYFVLPTVLKTCTMHTRLFSNLTLCNFVTFKLSNSCLYFTPFNFQNKTQRHFSLQKMTVESNRRHLSIGDEIVLKQNLSRFALSHWCVSPNLHSLHDEIVPERDWAATYKGLKCVISAVHLPFEVELMARMIDGLSQM